MMRVTALLWQFPFHVKHIRPSMSETIHTRACFLNPPSVVKFQLSDAVNRDTGARARRLGWTLLGCRSALVSARDES